MGFFKRAKRILKSNIKTEKNPLHKMQKDFDQIMRELKAKVDTAEAKLHQLEQQILEQQSKVQKLTRYERKATEQGETNTFALQKQQALNEIHALETKKIDLAAEAKQLNDAYQRLKQRQENQSAYLQVMKTEAKGSQQLAASVSAAEKYEEQVRKELAEAEALLELRKDSLQ